MGIWIQMTNSQGVKLVTNSCYLLCLVVKAAMCFALVLIDPFSRDLVWGIYEILSAFTATTLSAAQAFGPWGPFALFLFLCIYSAAHSQPQSQRRSKLKSKTKKNGNGNDHKQQTVNWSEEAQRNPFRGENSMNLVRSLLKEGDQ